MDAYRIQYVHFSTLMNAYVQVIKMDGNSNNTNHTAIITTNLFYKVINQLIAFITSSNKNFITLTKCKAKHNTVGVFRFIQSPLYS